MEMQKSEYIILYGGKWCTNPILIWNLGTNPNLLLQNGIEGCYWLQNSLHFLRRHPKSYFNLHRHGIRVLDHKSVGLQGSVDLESNLDYRFELELRFAFPSNQARQAYLYIIFCNPSTYLLTKGWTWFRLCHTLGKNEKIGDLDFSYDMCYPFVFETIYLVESSPESNVFNQSQPLETNPCLILNLNQTRSCPSFPAWFPAAISALETFHPMVLWLSLSIATGKNQ